LLNAVLFATHVVIS